MPISVSAIKGLSAFSLQTRLFRNLTWLQQVFQEKNLAKKKGEEEDNRIFFHLNLWLSCTERSLGNLLLSLSFLVRTTETQEILSGCNQGIGGEAMN